MYAFFLFQIIWLILLFDMCLWLGKRLLLFCQITLGHEIGAGAACLKCKDKCEGFDLHFWRFVLASFLHIYAMLSFMHVVFITINVSNRVGSSLIWLIFVIILSTHQHAIPYLSGKKLSHRESPGHYLHSVGFAEVRTTGAKMPVPELYHCSGGACHSQSLSWGFRNSLNEKTSMWIQVIGCRAWDFIFVFVSMQQGRATSHPVLNRISPVLVGFLWKLISTTENKNIFLTQFWELWVIIAII